MGLARSLRFTILVGLATLACGDEAPTEPGPADWTTCTEERDRWERCDEGRVIWCHAIGRPHFHSGLRCESLGLECRQLDERRAVCAEPNRTCEVGQFSCGPNNVADNCFSTEDGPTLGKIPCGTARTCVADEQASVATCFDDRPNALCGGLGDEYEGQCVCNFGFVVDASGARCVPPS